MTTFTHFIQHLPWVTIFGVLGNTISVMAILSPIPTFYRIYKNKSTEEFSSFPFAMGLFSGMMWLFYAIVKTDVIFLLTINSYDVFIEAVYLSIFIIYANKQIRTKTVKMLFLVIVLGLGAIVFITFVIAKTTKVRVKILGWICLVFSSSVYASPLGVMGKVIRTKSAQYMPFLLSMFLTISGFVWFFYGLCKHDFYVAIPNAIGFCFGMVQMVLHAIYRNGKPINEKLPILKNGVSNDEITLESVKIQPENAPTKDGNFTIEPPHVTNQDNNVEDKKIGLNGHNLP